ncbi:MAG: ATP-binding cassette domain-containing protein, partial [Solirubrobacterales bacterium]
PIETAALTTGSGSPRGMVADTSAVGPGDVLGSLAPNGAGKTTTIRTLLDLIHPTSGSARVFGLDSRRDSVAIRARLGNLPGDFGFGRETPGRQAVQLLARLRGIDGAGRAEELAARFRADLDRPLGQLSRGNRQKIGLILATFHRPELLILDEPTSGLDPLMQEEFLALVAEERDRGAAVFLSSHKLDEVQRVCDRVGIIRGGRLVAVERMADLLGKARRRFAVELRDPAGLERLRSLPGVADFKLAGNRATFSAGGDLDAVVRELAGHHVVDLEATHPSLEEIFLGYYEEAAG